MSARWTVGVDFGGTSVKAGLVDASGRVVATASFSTDEAARPAAFVERTSRAVESLARQAGVRPGQLRGVGIGAPGPVDVERGLVYSLMNVPGWRNVALARACERCLACRCFVDNDVNLMALGEWRFGAGRGAEQLVCLTLGTGVGGGLILNGALCRGASGAGGELGHMVIDPRGSRCGCGRRGCLEAHVGTAEILRKGRRLARRASTQLRASMRRSGGRLTPQLLSQAAQHGDAGARRLWQEIGQALGIGLANVVNLLNPDRMVIGGGIANAWRWFAPTMRQVVRDEAIDISARSVRIVRARLGNRAGIVGAAALVWDRTR